MGCLSFRLRLYPLHIFGIKMFFAEYETMIVNQSLGFSLHVFTQQKKKTKMLFHVLLRHHHHLFFIFLFVK